MRVTIYTAILLFSVGALADGDFIEFESPSFRWRYYPAEARYQVLVARREHTGFYLATRLYDDATKQNDFKKTDLQIDHWIDIEWKNVPPGTQSSIRKLVDRSQQKLANPIPVPSDQSASSTPPPVKTTTTTEQVLPPPAPRRAPAPSAILRHPSKIELIVGLADELGTIRQRQSQREKWLIVGGLVFSAIVLVAVFVTLVGLVRRLRAARTEAAETEEAAEGGGKQEQILPPDLTPITALIGRLEQQIQAVSTQVATLSGAVATLMAKDDLQRFVDQIRNTGDADVGGTPQPPSTGTVPPESPAIEMTGVPIAEPRLPGRSLLSFDQVGPDELLAAWSTAEESASKDGPVQYYGAFLSRFGVSINDYRLGSGVYFAASSSMPIAQIRMLENGKFFAVLPTSSTEYYVYPRASQFSVSRDYRARFEKLFGWPNVTAADGRLRVVEPAVVPSRLLEQAGLDRLDHWQFKCGKVEVE